MKISITNIYASIIELIIPVYPMVYPIYANDETIFNPPAGQPKFTGPVISFAVTGLSGISTFQSKAPSSATISIEIGVADGNQLGVVMRRIIELLDGIMAGGVVNLSDGYDADLEIFVRSFVIQVKCGGF